MNGCLLQLGKDLFRAKSREEDITISNEITGITFPVSLKAYGDGPLQLSTDKDFQIYPLLAQHGDVIEDAKKIAEIFQNPALANFDEMNVLPLIYDEKKQRCNILVFDGEKAKNSTSLIRKESAGAGRKHPVYRFYDSSHNYICEVRYGDATANALQRGLWTNTKNALPFFDSVTDGWIDYSHNRVLVQLFSHALVASEAGHAAALYQVQADIEKLKNGKN